MTAAHPYDAVYFERSFGQPYDRQQGQWLVFFGEIADHIVGEIRPKTVLDVGCAKGFLVESLRDRGVEAFGTDISEYAIGEVRQDIQPYCRVASATAPWTEHYDLVTCIEVVEHLLDEESRQVIANICESTGDVLFSSSPDDFDEPTHQNVRPRSYWVERFAEHGFALDVDYDAGFIAPQAMRFRVGAPQDTVIDRLLEQRSRLLKQADDRLRLLAIERTISWKLLQRGRRVRDWLLPRGTRRWSLYLTGRRAVEVLLDEGAWDVVLKARHKIMMALRTGRSPLVQERAKRDDEQYAVWVERHRLTDAMLNEMHQAARGLAYQPLISILTPVYNTDEDYLRTTVESVRAQTYPHWQLCLANDGSTRSHVREILDTYAASDQRILVQHAVQNAGIVAASNQALNMATGEFVGLLDHDDVLSPDALFEVVNSLNERRGLDLIYSDEDKLEGERRVEPFFKPDWSPDLLMSCNYITHFGVYRRSLVLKVGGFRPGFDGSQDYDLLLRVTEQTGKITHVPKILYHWRKTRGSAAGSATAKPFAYVAARRALQEALERRGVDGRVEPEAPGSYRTHYTIQGQPLVSIIIPTRDEVELLRHCIQSLEERTRYRPYEILVVNNDSSDPATLGYLSGSRWPVLDYPGPFNFAALNNFAVEGRAKGDYLLFLNNDTKVIEAAWLDAMLEHAQRPEVGAVGAKLLYPDGRIQHAGIVLGVGGPAAHLFRGQHDDQPLLTRVVRDCSAVTGACFMVRRKVFEEVGGFDPRFKVAYNDVDLCLRLRERGYRIVYTPLALLHHHESATRGEVRPTQEEALLWSLWGAAIRRGDPYYNRNLSRTYADWSIDL